MIIEKHSVSDFVYLYGCEVDDLILSREERLLMHTQQRIKANELLERLMDHPYTERDHRRINDVIKAVRWNEEMIKKLRG